MKSVTASSLRPSSFDPEEIRAIVQRSKNAGLLRGAAEATPVKKDGIPVVVEKGLRSVWMDVSPELAKKWLENNFRNRTVSDDVVDAYARDMTNGIWVPTHQGVAFNDRDELIDGQHRLMAIIRCGKTIRMMVTFGLPSEVPGKEMTTMDAVDRGRTRSVADQLKIQHGLKNGTVIAAMAASIANICCGERTRRLSVGQSLEIYRAFEGPVTWVIMHRPRTVGIRATGVLAGFAFAMATESEDLWAGTTEVQAMFQQLLEESDEQPNSPISRLRSFLRSDDAKLLNRGTDRALAELVLQAIFLEQQHKRISKLELSTEGVEHFRSLQNNRVERIAGIFRLPNSQVKIHTPEHQSLHSAA